MTKKIIEKIEKVDLKRLEVVFVLVKLVCDFLVVILTKLIS